MMRGWGRPVDARSKDRESSYRKVEGKDLVCRDMRTTGAGSAGGGVMDLK